MRKKIRGYAAAQLFGPTMTIQGGRPAEVSRRVTKAGSFDTFVIETEFTGKNVQDPRLSNQYSWRTWFDPKIDHWVKRSIVWRQSGHVVSDDTYELTEYGRRKEQ